mmetsp:Transcript_42950/g.68897  ORF Transcript_42950/g.68897 Transcript_42950/m.68897 type:complete len:402 (+) Transcript_42950:66-1271(+)|eukprot:CAMPEP_0197058466 /NCGR_PEP_ID=MMETSP1384-20130603/108255_1 /TAXON_ID=29189 /ORGANISM="Ammonia sp." /LENGTH=401 /DNA_ID=CAMNT_0042493223 /DNA_START=65 /DNA_END=1270 /DNA_ORIENTATION=+
MGALLGGTTSAPETHTCKKHISPVQKIGAILQASANPGKASTSYEAHCSGWIINKNGGKYIATAAHCFDHVDEKGRREKSGRLLWCESWDTVAFMKLKKADKFKAVAEGCIPIKQYWKPKGWKGGQNIVTERKYDMAIAEVDAAFRSPTGTTKMRGLSGFDLEKINAKLKHAHNYVVYGYPEDDNILAEFDVTNVAFKTYTGVMTFGVKCFPGVSGGAVLEIDQSGGKKAAGILHGGLVESDDLIVITFDYLWDGIRSFLDGTAFNAAAVDKLIEFELGSSYTKATFADSILLDYPYRDEPVYDHNDGDYIPYEPYVGDRFRYVYQPSVDVPAVNFGDYNYQPSPFEALEFTLLPLLAVVLLFLFSLVLCGAGFGVGYLFGSRHRRRAKENVDDEQNQYAR